jgi:hypothetical protein
MASFWNLVGNPHTNPSVDFLGTTDQEPLVFKTDDKERLRIDSTGNVGIGTLPSFKLHVGTGDHGLRVEGPNPATPTPILASFGGNGDFNIDAVNVVGGRFTVKDTGSVGIGNASPSAELSLVSHSATELTGTAASKTLRVSSTGPGPSSGSYSAPASFGCFVDGNNISLGVRIYRHIDQGTGWQSTIIGLSMDVDNTIGAGGSLVLSPNGDIGPAKVGSGIFFPDGTRQTTAALQGPAGPSGPAGPQGPPGVSPPPQVVLSRNAAGGGFVSLLGPGGRQTVQLTGVAGAPNAGIISVTDAAGAAANVFKAAMAVDASGMGTITATVKNFRVPHPSRADADIVYACIEGPEAAAYVRGTTRLINGKGVISLPEHFVAVAGVGGMTVQVTPLSSHSLGLAVVEKRSSEILVTELNHGTGNYDFDWEVKSVRKGHEGYQVVRDRSETALVPSPP